MSALGHVRKSLQHAGDCRRVYGRDYSDLFLDFFRIIKNGYYPSEYDGPMLLEMNAFTPRPVYQKLNRGLMLTVYGDVLRAKNNVF